MHADLDARIRRAVLARIFGKHVRAHRQRRTQLERADVEVAHALDRVAALLQRLQRAAGVRKERRAHLREPHAAAVALEQRLAQIALERLDARGDGGLREEQRVRRLAEGAVLGDLYKRLDLSEVHDGCLTIRAEAPE